MRDKLFVDTNILVYLANESSDFHEAVSKQFQQVSTAYDLFISRQVLREYTVIMTRPGIIEHPLTPDEVVEDIHKWKKLFTVADETQTVTEKLLSLLKKYQLILLCHVSIVLYRLRRRDSWNFHGYNT